MTEDATSCSVPISDLSCETAQGYMEVEMYCKNCGEKLNDNDRVCPACGTPVDRTETTNGGFQGSQAKGAPNNGPQTYYNGASQQSYEYNGPAYQSSADSGSIGWGFLGCCFPLIGLILFLVWKDTKPLSAKKAGIGAIIGVVVTVLLYLLVIALGIGASILGVAAGEIDMSELEQYLDQTTDILANRFMPLF